MPRHSIFPIALGSQRFCYDCVVFTNPDFFGPRAQQLFYGLFFFSLFPFLFLPLCEENDWGWGVPSQGSGSGPTTP